MGQLPAAYIATKLTQPLRIAATLALTPVVARVYERMRPSAARVREGVAPASGPSVHPEAPGPIESDR